MIKGIVLMIMILFLTGCTMNQEESGLIHTQETLSSVITETPETVILQETVPPVEPDLLNVLIDPKDEDFVRVKDYIPGVITELKYATSNNFTGQMIYEFEDVFLRYGTVMKLKAVGDELAQQGLYLKIWDGFRPISAQFKLWDICPDDTYVANPNQGYSNHSRGFAVDLTLVDAEGRELPMPTGFDDFSARADRDYSECDPVAAENARRLEAIMEKYGFQGYWGEWWHFNDTQKYDVEVGFDPAVISRRYTETGLDLLEVFWDPSTVILKIPAGEGVTLLGYREEHSMVEYWGYRGYLPTESLLKK